MATLAEDQAAIQRRQKMAEMLMAQGAEPLETNQTAGGFVVPVSPLAGVAKIAQQLSGTYLAKQADKSQSDLNDKKAGIVQALFSGNTQPGLSDIAASGLASPSELMTMGNAQRVAEISHNDKLDEKKLSADLAAQQREQDQKFRAEQAQIARDQSFAQQQQMAQLAASLRPAPQPHQDALVQVMGENGQPVYAPSSQAVGKQAFNAQMAKPDTPKLNPTIEKEIFEADDLANKTQNAISMLSQAKELNKQPTYSGYAAHARAMARSNMPGESPEASNTINLDNIMQSQALEQLKATFGGNPTEGERAILLELQASSNKTPQDREKIINRAIDLANKRLTFHTQKGASLRNGDYFNKHPAVISDAVENSRPNVIRFDANGNMVK